MILVIHNKQPLKLKPQDMNLRQVALVIMVYTTVKTRMIHILMSDKKCICKSRLSQIIIASSQQKYKLWNFFKYKLY
jgi:hypothetical protein